MPQLARYGPNALSVARIIMGVGVCILITRHDWKLAAWIFSIAAVTDLADGRLARHLGVSSILGGRLDKLGDFALVGGTVIGFWLTKLVSTATIIQMSLIVVATFSLAWLLQRREDASYKDADAHNEPPTGMARLIRGAFAGVIVLLAIWIFIYAYR